MLRACDVRERGSVSAVLRLRRGGVDVSARLDALEQAMVLADDRLDDDAVAGARAVAGKSRERLALGPEAVVVALAGGTGSGKSSLLNVLAGERLAEVGARRPVTADVTALVVGDGGSDLLDWLGVRRRHNAAPAPGLADGLIILDLPDHDSVELDHRLTADSFIERVDVLVWVVDPLKYAQRSLHAGYLRRLAAHAEVVVVALNRADELDAVGRDACLGDLRRLLSDAGLDGARVLATSAATGEGIDDLRALLAGEARQRRAIAERLAADIRTVAAPLRAETGEPARTVLDSADVVEALAATAGVEALGDSAQRLYRQTARGATRPLVSRVLWAPLSFLIRPVRLLLFGTRPRPPTEEVPAGRRQVTASPAAVRHALLILADRATEGLPDRWGIRMRGLAARTGGDLVDAAGRALERTSLLPRRRRWWVPVLLVWSLAELVMLSGALWLAILAGIAWLQLPAPPVPDAVGELPWPTALLAGGALAWLLIGWVRRALVNAGARRHRRRLVRRVRATLADVAEQQALQPLRAELDTRNALADHLRVAAR